MSNGDKTMRKGLLSQAWLWTIVLFFLLSFSLAEARSAKPEPLDKEGKRTWIIELVDPSVTHFDGRNAFLDRANRMEATAPSKRGKRFNPRSAPVVAYSKYLDERFEVFLRDAKQTIGEKPRVRAQLRNLLNGATVRLTVEQAERIRRLPGVKSVRPSEILRMESDSSPALIGATKVWAGEGGFPPARGEGIVIGFIDTGINWDHPSFTDPAPDGYNFSNPLGSQLGLCSDPIIPCNNKLIGVYEFTDEGSAGKDTNFHGSHVASIAAGNQVSVSFDVGEALMEGIAPRANIVSYKVCREDNPDTEEDEEGCQTSHIVEALEQALIDEVDVINVSLGGGTEDPWTSSASIYLSLRNAGIFVATSAGNDGPTPETGTDPGVAPWLLSVAASTNSRNFGATLTDLSGGGTPAPDLAGPGAAPVNGSADGYGPARIVWAGDYGHPLCGVGEPELLPNCDDHSGSSNPFEPGTFDGEIVVCERGEYGRVEKGFNVMEAGAGGYILINSQGWGEAIVEDSHCVTGIHLGHVKGQELRSWLSSGSGHTGSIGSFGLSYHDSLADVVADFSSRGPNPTVPGVLSPEITAPGALIMGASKDDNNVTIVSGTSQASPHIAGAGALLLSVHPDLTPSQVQSMLQTTAVTEARTMKGERATPFDRGSGRVQLDEATRAGLFMAVSGTDFLAANPSTGGDPATLNLPALVNSSCRENCSFRRTVSDQSGGQDWTVSPAGFPSGATVTITPSSFSIPEGGGQQLQIDFELGLETVGQWVFGEIVLSSDGLPDQHLTAAVFSDGGDLPSNWTIDSDSNGGWIDFELDGLRQMPDAAFAGGGLVAPSRFTESLPEDPTNFDPLDSDQGVMTTFVTVPEGSIWLHASTLPSAAIDLDLFVGRDGNDTEFAEDYELLCRSVSPGDVESCDIYMPPAGTYWIRVQNWAASEEGASDEATLLTAVVGPQSSAALAASGPGIVEENGEFTVRVSWDNVNALPGEQWLGAVAIGTHDEFPGNIGVIPVRLNRNGTAPAETFPLLDGKVHGLALDAGGMHDRLFIDVPPGASSLTVEASGADGAQSDALSLDLVRLDFEEALANAPFAVPPGSATVVASDIGNGGTGPLVIISGESIQPGRWYAVLSNSAGTPAAVEISADVEASGSPAEGHRGLWMPSSRPELRQGYDYNWGDGKRSLVWYTYGEDGQPEWFIAVGPPPDQNIWTADLLRVTNDGSAQKLSRVGDISVTSLAENDALFSFTLFGESGTDRMQPISAQTCPHIDGSAKSYTGLWSREEAGLGGASILVNSSTQSQIHYLFDAQGMPRWLVAQELDNPSPTDDEMPTLQFSGYCALCEDTGVTFDSMGVLGRGFSSETTGSWTIDYLFNPPLNGSANRTDEIIKLTSTLECR